MNLQEAMEYQDRKVRDYHDAGRRQGKSAFMDEMVADALAQGLSVLIAERVQRILIPKRGAPVDERCQPGGELIQGFDGVYRPKEQG